VTGIVAEVRIVDGGEGELAALYEWLRGEDELRGRIRAVRGPIGETELGPAVELLTVALGAGGAGTVLASSLKTWLLTRRTTAKIVVESAGRSVTVDVQSAGDVARLVEQMRGEACRQSPTNSNGKESVRDNSPAVVDDDHGT
jgi:Effector Associated Constant Component 1